MKSRKRNKFPAAAIAVVGPTASGKSDLSVAIARFIKRTFRDLVPIVVSADSRQVYRGLDVASGKIAKKEMGGIPHYLLDVADPKRIYSVTRYQRDVRRILASLARKSEKEILPIIVGGTGQYVDAVLMNISFPPVRPNLALRAKLERFPTDELFQKLAASDPERAKAIDRHNRRRLVRALEIISVTQSPVAPLRTMPTFLHVLKIGIRLPKDALRERVHLRLLERLPRIIREVALLRKNNLSWKRLDDLGLECRFVSRFLRGLLTRDEMTRQLESAINAYAKRQMTWFKRDKEILWFNHVPVMRDWSGYVKGFIAKEVSPESF